VTIADTRSSTAAENFSAVFGCAFDFDFDFLLAQRATIGRGRIDPVKCGARAPGKGAKAPGNLARKRLKKALS
jgi:hypothetical protein